MLITASSKDSNVRRLSVQTSVGGRMVGRHEGGRESMHHIESQPSPKIASCLEASCMARGCKCIRFQSFSASTACCCSGVEVFDVVQTSHHRRLVSISARRSVWEAPAPFGAAWN